MSSEPVELVPLKRELQARKADLQLLPRETQLEIMAATMDIRGLEAMLALREEQHAHVMTKKETRAEITALRKTVSELTNEKKLLERKLKDAEENLKRNSKMVVCTRCQTLTTTDRDKSDMLRMIDACVILRAQLEKESLEMIEAAVDPTPKERCECGYFRLVGGRCSKCRRVKDDPLPDHIAPPGTTPKDPVVKT